MKKTIVTFVILSCFKIDAQNIDIPYFGKIPSGQLCGSSGACQPSSSNLYAKVSDKIYYGNPKNDLYRRFKESFFNNSSCKTVTVTQNDVVTAKETTLELLLKEDKKTAFVTELNANIINLIKQQIPSISDSLVGKLTASFKSDLSSEVNKKIQVQFKIIDLKQDFIDENIDKCQALKKEYISTGISVVSIKGTWTREVFKKLFADFEASVSYTKDLSVKAKEDFQKAKDTLINGSVEEFSIIIAVAYRKANVSK